jgi:hypothetical protein
VIIALAWCLIGVGIATSIYMHDIMMWDAEWEDHTVVVVLVLAWPVILLGTLLVTLIGALEARKEHKLKGPSKWL